jgi:hypothetical protein
VASAQGGPISSNSRVAGEWGYTKTGAIYLPTGVVAPFGSIGTFALDPDGTVVGTQLARVGVIVGGGELYGTFTIDPSCTGTTTVSIYDPSGNLLRTVSMSVVVDDKARELRALVTSLVLPNDTPLPAVITGDARRAFMSVSAEQ